MKKWLLTTLCIFLLLSLCACGEKAPEAAPASPLQVGFGRADITPDFKMPLQGYPGPADRIFNRVLDPIYATCIAFSDGENTVLLYSLDLTDSCWEAVVLAKSDIQKATGVPFGNIMASCTHNHSAPSFIEYFNKERYVTLLREQMLSAAQDAIGDLKSAQLYIGSIEAEGLNAIRHYTLADGGVAGDNFGEKDGMVYIGHAGKADTTMQVLRVAREGGKDIVISNWQAHPHRTGGGNKLDLSSDIVGPMRTYVEENADCHFAYFTGASGNLNSTSRIAGENSALNYVDHGIELGQYACLALTDMTPVAPGKVQMKTQKYAPLAKNNDKPGQPVDLHAISIGDVAFVVVNYEMFCQNGQFVKENSPFAMTFVATVANINGGYVPSENNYEYNGMESYEATKCYYRKGAGEELAQQYVNLLTSIYDTRGSVTAPALSQSKLYWNLDHSTERTPNGDGSYTARFLCDGQLLTLTVPEDMMAAIDLHDLLGLTVEGTSVTGYIPLSQLPESLLCRDYCVQTMGGSTIKVNANDRLTGKELVLKLKDIPIYDASAVATTPGASVTLQKGDLVTALQDADGKLICVYLSGREGIYTPVQRYCEHCKKDVEFLNWFRSNALPTVEGHYYLEKDVTLSATQIISSNNVTVDLNGKTITQTVEGEGIYWMRDSSYLTIMDSVGTGTLIPASTKDDSNYTIWKGLCVRMETNAKELNIYGGTFDGSKATAQHCCTVDNMMGTMNIYGGTFIGGNTYGAGGAAIMAQDRTNIYGGTFIGGHSANTDYVTEGTKGGGTLFVADPCTLNIYGGTFTGGTADGNGGNVLCYGKLILHGGTFEGGAADGLGDTMYVDGIKGILEFAGDVKISGEVMVSKDSSFSVTEDCKLKVSQSADGTLNIR